MIPMVIEDNEVWEGARHRIISPPDGDLDNEKIGPVDAVIDLVDGTPRFNMKLRFEEGELERLQNGGHIWVSMWGHVVPWCAQVVGGEQ